MNVIMKALPNGISSKIGRTALQLSKHSPNLLFAGGVVGVVATTVLASKATLKLDETLQERRDNLQKANMLHEEKRVDYTDQDYSRDILIIQARNAVALGKLYAPAIVTGFVSIAMLTKSHTILTSRYAGVTAAYAALDKGFREYRERVDRIYGPVADDAFRHGHRFDEVEKVNDKGESEIKTVVRVGAEQPSVYARFFDEYSQQWSKTPEYNLIFLRCQQNYANDLLRSRGHIFLNEVYDLLGIPRSRAGAVVGWVIRKGGADNYVDFGIFDETSERARAFVNGQEGAILLDFNVDGVIYDQI